MTVFVDYIEPLQRFTQSLWKLGCSTYAILPVCARMYARARTSLFFSTSFPQFSNNINAGYSPNYNRSSKNDISKNPVRLLAIVYLKLFKKLSDRCKRVSTAK